MSELEHQLEGLLTQRVVAMERHGSVLRAVHEAVDQVKGLHRETWEKLNELDRDCRDFAKALMSRQSPAVDLVAAPAGEPAAIPLAEAPPLAPPKPPEYRPKMDDFARVARVLTEGVPRFKDRVAKQG